jgi:hypothetical protein
LSARSPPEEEADGVAARASAESNFFSFFLSHATFEKCFFPFILKKILYSFLCNV